MAGIRAKAKNNVEYNMNLKEKDTRTQIKLYEAKYQPEVEILFRSGLTSYDISEDIKVLQSHFVESKLSHDGDMFNIYNYYITSNSKRSFWVAVDQDGMVVGCVGAIENSEDPESLELVRMSVSKVYLHLYLIY